MTEKMTAFFDRFEIEMTEDQALSASHPGRCDEDVAALVAELNLEIDPALLAAELREYGAWDDEELQDHAANMNRIVWIAACNIKEDLR